MPQKTFDLIVFGATGFTGRLVAEYLHQRYGPRSDLAGNPTAGPAVTWAMAGRNLQKLTQARASLGADCDVPLIVADAGNSAELEKLVAQTRAVITTVGPYTQHGEPLALASARAGADYVDLCGEPLWMARMIPLLQKPAAASGARIVFSCGFDSIPFDLGVVHLQAQATRQFGAPLVAVQGRVKSMKGAMSGGTAASMMATLAQVGHDAAAKRQLADPFALTPGFSGPAQPDGESAAYDEVAKSWSGPFMMAVINTKNVHRTHALRGHPWGKGFTYDERLFTGDGFKGKQLAKALARSTKVQNLLMSFELTRNLIGRFVLPKPGQGPSLAEREAGRYHLVFSGETAQGQRLSVRVKGDRDPGYGSTCKMIAEAALCLVQDVDRRMTPGGVWTPGAAMGLTLVRRLQARAGLTFETMLPQ